jgi:cytoskeletal protein CcmA (bactofilin family)
MFKKKTSQLLQSQKISFNSVLGAGCVIHGKLEVAGNYHVVGQVLGDISRIGDKGILWVNKLAHVRGNIICGDLVLAGRLEGNVLSSGVVEICSSAIIIGDIQSERLHVNSNARINGRLSCFNSNDIEDVIKTMPPNSNLEN